MRIAVDASSLVGEITGMGRFTQQMLLSLQNHQVEIFLYSHSSIDQAVALPRPTNLRCGTFSFRLARILWSQFIFPIWALTDRVDVFWGPNHRIPILLSRRIARVVTIHDMVWKICPQTMRRLNFWLDKILMPLSLRLADQIMAVSDSTRNEVINFYPYSRGRITTVRPGVPRLFSKFEFSNSCHRPRLDYRYFIFVGTIEPRKNVPKLLEAYSLLKEQFRQKMKLLIVGGQGWGSIDISSLVERHGLQENVVNMGYVSDSVLAGLYKNAEFLALPSLNEGFGLPILEAISRDIPVLTSNCASMPEVAGDAGIYVDPSSAISIALGLQRIIQDDCLRGRLRRNCMRQRQKFSWESAATLAVDVFRRATATRRISIDKE